MLGQNGTGKTTFIRLLGKWWISVVCGTGLATTNTF
jgi:ABC-type Na+ transport system ATPase subunit NatA